MSIFKYAYVVLYIFFLAPFFEQQKIDISYQQSQLQTLINEKNDNKFNNIFFLTLPLKVKKTEGDVFNMFFELANLMHSPTLSHIHNNPLHNNVSTTYINITTFTNQLT